jgi:hypothetical protein
MPIRGLLGNLLPGYREIMHRDTQTARLPPDRHRRPPQNVGALDGYAGLPFGIASVRCPQEWGEGVLRALWVFSVSAHKYRKAFRGASGLTPHYWSALLRSLRTLDTTTLPQLRGRSRHLLAVCLLAVCGGASYQDAAQARPTATHGGLR